MISTTAILSMLILVLPWLSTADSQTDSPVHTRESFPDHLRIKRTAPPRPAVPFSVMTFNLWNQMFLWEARRDFIVEMIKARGPDIIALQEVLDFSEAGGTQVQQLQDRLPGYNFNTYVPTGTSPSGHPEGLAFLSRIPFHTQATRSLMAVSGSPDRNNRALVW